MTLSRVSATKLSQGVQSLSERLRVNFISSKGPDHSDHAGAYSKLSVVFGASSEYYLCGNSSGTQGEA